MKKHTCSPLAPPRLTLAPPGASGGTLPDENVSKNMRKTRVGEHRHTNKFHESASKNIRKNMSEHYSHSNEFPRNTHETNVQRRFFTVPLRCAPKLLARRSGRRPPGYIYFLVCTFILTPDIWKILKIYGDITMDIWARPPFCRSHFFMSNKYQKSTQCSKNKKKKRPKASVDQNLDLC